MKPKKQSSIPKENFPVLTVITSRAERLRELEATISFN